MEIPDSLQIRDATPADIPALVELERKCETSAHWSDEQYQEMFHPDRRSQRLALMVVSDPETQELETLSGEETTRASRLLAFLIAHNVGLEWELENVVVAPSSRRKGLGARLLKALMEHARITDSASVFLEVRESNAPARGLYEKLGFKEAGRRKGYYLNPGEDAILYKRSL
jgi:[ribosomal protein S18]-alanine N-acetyltransferase